MWYHLRINYTLNLRQTQWPPDFLAIKTTRNQITHRHLIRLVLGQAALVVSVQLLRAETLWENVGEARLFVYLAEVGLLLRARDVLGVRAAVVAAIGAVECSLGFDHSGTVFLPEYATGLGLWNRWPILNWSRQFAIAFLKLFTKLLQNQLGILIAMQLLLNVARHVINIIKAQVGKQCLKLRNLLLKLHLSFCEALLLNLDIKCLILHWVVVAQSGLRFIMLKHRLILWIILRVRGINPVV